MAPDLGLRLGGVVPFGVRRAAAQEDINQTLKLTVSLSSHNTSPRTSAYVMGTADCEHRLQFISS